jgi:hypothetical protein
MHAQRLRVQAMGAKAAGRWTTTTDLNPPLEHWSFYGTTTTICAFIHSLAIDSFILYSPLFATLAHFHFIVPFFYFNCLFQIVVVV